jgi:hypothetical protein
LESTSLTGLFNPLIVQQLHIRGIMSLTVLQVARQIKRDGHVGFRRRGFLLTAIGIAAGMLIVSRGAAQVGTNAIAYLNSSYQAGYALVANQLEAPENTVGKLITSPPEGTELVVLDGQVWRTNVFSSAGGGWTIPEMSLAPGQAALLHSTADWIQVWVGRVREGEYEILIPAGGSLRGSPIPQAGPLSGSLYFPKVVGTRIYKVDSTTGQLLLRATCTEAGWEPEDPVLDVGEGFYIEAPHEFVWARTFNFELAISHDDQGGVLLTPERLSGRTATIEVSSDLIHWDELHDGEQGHDGSVLDRSASHEGIRFYRGRLD